MYIKKPVLIIGAILLVIITATLTFCVINPFGIREADEFLLFIQAVNTVERDFYQEVDREELLHNAIYGMTLGLNDPYSRYIWGEEADAYMEELSGSYCGVGLYIENNMEEDVIQVVSAIAGGPAEEAGLTTGDIILKVNGTEYSGQEINEATSVMRGEAGTEVTLTIRKKADGTENDIKLVRREIELPSVTGEMVTDTIGRISITQFTEGCAVKFQEKFQELRNDGMESLVLDLRNNPGGLLDEAISISEMFLENGKLVIYTEDRQGNRQEYKAKGETVSIPIAILTNPGSASASEVVTGALKDHGVGYHIGEKTYGKGVVQKVYYPGQEGILSLTVARYFTPNGDCIHEKGIVPDLEVPMDIEKYQNLSELAPEEDDQLRAAIEHLEQ